MDTKTIQIAIVPVCNQCNRREDPVVRHCILVSIASTATMTMCGELRCYSNAEMRTGPVTYCNRKPQDTGTEIHCMPRDAHYSICEIYYNDIHGFCASTCVPTCATCTHHSTHPTCTLRHLPR